MKTPPVQTETATEVGKAAPSTELAERLLRRHSQPLGVIDVQRPQHQYARTAGWVAQRFSLLDHWKTRYGGDGEASAPSASFVFVAQGQSLTESRQQPASPIQLARAEKQTVKSQPDARTTTLPTEQFRVRRRGASPQPLAVVRSQADSVSSTVGEVATARAANNSVSVPLSHLQRSEVRTTEFPLVVASQTAPTPGGAAETKGEGETVRHVAQASSRETPSLPAAPAGQTPTENFAKAISSSYRHSDMSLSTVAAPGQTFVQVSRIKASSAELPFRPQRKVNQATASVARGDNLTVSATPLPTGQMSLVESPPSDMMPSLAGREDEARNLINSLAEQTNLTRSPAWRSTGESTAPLPLIQRQPANGVRATEPLRTTGSGSDPSVTMAAEVHVPSPSVLKSAMIWRQSAGEPSSAGAFAEGKTSRTKSTLPLAINMVSHGEPRVTRQSPTAGAVSSPSAESLTPAVTPSLPSTPQAQEIDIERLADQVSDVIGRRLEIERERRGITRWH